MDQAPEWFKQSRKESPEWFYLHEQSDLKAFAARPTKDEMRQIVHDALIEFFTAKGILSKNIILTTAVIIGSLVVIGGGFKWLLGLIGFTYIK